MFYNLRAWSFLKKLSHFGCFLKQTNSYQSNTSVTLGVARERLVVAESVWLVLPVPAGAAEILETL